MLSAAGLAILWDRQRKKGALVLPFAVLSAVLAVSAVLSALTIAQIGCWKDSLTLWNRQIEVYPGRGFQVYNQRGIVHGEAGRHIEALSDFNMAIALNGKDALAYNNRGLTYMEIGELGRAIEDFRVAASLNPSWSAPYASLSLAYMRMGEKELSIETAEKAGKAGYSNEMPWL